MFDVTLGTYSCKKCWRSEEHTSELQSRSDLVCRLLLEKKKNNIKNVLSARAGSGYQHYTARRWHTYAAHIECQVRGAPPSRAQYPLLASERVSRDAHAEGSI